MESVKNYEKNNLNIVVKLFNNGNNSGNEYEQFPLQHEEQY